MRLRVTDAAKSDVEEIGDFIALENPDRAESVVRELWATCDGLLEYPLRFPVLPLKATKQFRQRIFRSYRIVYVVKSDVVYVARILHAARDYESVLFPDD